MFPFWRFQCYLCLCFVYFAITFLLIQQILILSVIPTARVLFLTTHNPLFSHATSLIAHILRSRRHLQCCWDVFHGTVVSVSQCGDSRLSSLLLCLLLIPGLQNVADIVIVCQYLYQCLYLWEKHGVIKHFFMIKSKSSTNTLKFTLPSQCCL